MVTQKIDVKLITNMLYCYLREWEREGVRIFFKILIWCTEKNYYNAKLVPWYMYVYFKTLSKKRWSHSLQNSNTYMRFYKQCMFLKENLLFPAQKFPNIWTNVYAILFIELNFNLLLSKHYVLRWFGTPVNCIVDKKKRFRIFKIILKYLTKNMF